MYENVHRKIGKIISIIFISAVLCSVGFYFCIKKTNAQPLKAELDNQAKLQLAIMSGWSDEENKNYAEISWGTTFFSDKEDVQLIREEITGNEIKKEIIGIQPNTTSYLDDRVIDTVAPEIPEVKISEEENNKLKIVIFTQDKGTIYQWYLKSPGKDGTSRKSSIIKEELVSDIQGYIYVIDDFSETEPTIERNEIGEVTNITEKVELPNVAISISEITSGSKWLHVVAVDRLNNVSKVQHTKMKKSLPKKQMLATRNNENLLDFSLVRQHDKLLINDLIVDDANRTLENKKMKSLEIKTPINVTIKDIDTKQLPNGWTRFENSMTAAYRSYVFVFNNNYLSSTIQNFLKELTFKVEPMDDKKNPVSVDESGEIEIIVHKLAYTSWEDSQENIHHYAFIEGNTNWLAAYNSAKKLEYKGLQGYLATLTSEIEHDFVYDNIAKKSGWLGGSRAVSTAGKKINNTDTISQSISSYNLAVNNSKEWYWACGPDTGLVFFKQATYTSSMTMLPNVYQGFNNPRNSKENKYEPNNYNNTGEAFLEFAQGSASKWWNDLAYNTKVEGFYVEFFQPVVEPEKEEVTDVAKSSQIPQKISLKAYDKSGNSLPEGDILFDTYLKIGNKVTVSPKKINFYNFLQLVDGSGVVIPKNEMYVGTDYQEGKLIYDDEKFTVHTRQVIIDSNKEIVSPSTGYSVLISKTESNEVRDELSLNVTASKNNEMDFDTFVIDYESSVPNYSFLSKVPMNYQLIGYTLTTTQQHHQPEASKLSAIVNVKEGSEIWVTTYLKPTIEKPTFYHWDYRENKLGTITIN
ncbi:C-type lectin-like domain-containing protein [Enterococcus sp. LJL99]